MKALLTIFTLLLVQIARSQTKTINPKDTIVSSLLKDVRVSATKRAIEVQPDKTVINVGAQLYTAGENVLQLLRRSPGVVVDANDNIQMNGKSGVTVLIDGKNTQLAGNDLAELLKSIEAGNILQLELITNPSAKYDAAGNAGIINIKLKKSLTNGFNGNLTASHAQSIHSRQTASINLNYRYNKTAFFVNGGLNDGLQHTVANNRRISGTQLFTQQGLEKDKFNGNSIRAGADYFLNKKLTLGALWMGNYKATNMDNISTTTLQLPANPDTLIFTRSSVPFKTLRNAINLNAAYNTAKVQYTLDADYTWFNSSVNNLVLNQFTDVMAKPFSNSAINNNQKVNIKIGSVKGDWTFKLPEQYDLESGFKLVTSQTNNKLIVQNQSGLQWLPDTGKTNFFDYRESVYSAYSSLKKGGKKFTWQAGLRAEYSVVKGESTDLKNNQTNRPDTAYLNLFPTLYIQYQLAPKHQVNLTANRRIDRPNYQDQNPFIYALDALNSEQGNAYLIPQFTNSIEAGYTYNYATAVKVSYAKTTGYIEQLTYQNGRYTIMIPQNSGTRQMLNFAVSTPVQIRKWWSLYVSAGPYYHYYKTNLQGYGFSQMQQAVSWGLNGYAGNTFVLGKGYKADVSGWFNYQNRATIYTSKPIGSINVAFQKNILKNKANINLNFYDLFNTQRWQQKAQTDNISLTTYRKWESRNITFGFSWRMGNTKIKNARERQTVAEESAGRIK